PPPAPSNTHSPYTTLFRSQEDGHTGSECPRGWNHVRHCTRSVVRTLVPERFQFYETSRALTLISALNSFETGQPVSEAVQGGNQDRKSTRLNSSHVAISYA